MAYLIKTGIIIATCIAGGAHYLYSTSFAPSLTQVKYLEQTGVDSIKQIGFILDNFLLWAQNFGKAMIYRLNEYLRMLNYFGPFKYGYEVLAPIFLFTYAKICYQEDGIKIKFISKILVFLMALGIYFVTCFAMYLSWTGVGALTIEGVQGRYFIPLLMLCVLLFTSEKFDIGSEEKEKKHVVDISIISIMLSSMLITIVSYYY